MTINTLVFFGLLLRHECSSSILDWFSWTKSYQEFENRGVPLLNIPFEELKSEDKFLIEASKITGLKLSQLDACQHKLIMKLKASCGSLADEELAKLSVNLLNCQADVEGRRTYPCNEDMSIRECTSAMDPETWNAYHIMSNRARAVCYVARQEQFRALAEMTVNKLVSSARSHLQQMDIINDNQQKLEKLSQLALDRLSRSQHDVLLMYSKLKRLESSFATSLTDDKTTLEQLSTLVDNERNEINLIFSDFRKFIEETENNFRRLKDIKSTEHEKVLNDLLLTQQIAQDLNKLLDNLSTMSATNYRKSLTQYDTSQKHLEAMNKSLAHIFGQLEALEKIVHEKSSLVYSLIGPEGENLNTILTSILHMLCLLVAMVVTSFLELPKRLKALLLTSGILNTYLSLQSHDYAVPLSLLYLTLASITAVDQAAVQVITLYHRRHNKDKDHCTSPQDKKTHTTNFTQNGTFEHYSKVNDWLVERNAKLNDFNLRNGISPQTPLPLRKEDEMSERSERSTRSKSRKNTSPARSLAGSSTSSRRTTCAAIRLNGLRCKLPAIPGLTTCRVHQEQR